MDDVRGRKQRRANLVATRLLSRLGGPVSGGPTCGNLESLLASTRPRSCSSNSSREPQGRTRTVVLERTETRGPGRPAGSKNIRPGAERRKRACGKRMEVTSAPTVAVNNRKIKLSEADDDMACDVRPEERNGRTALRDKTGRGSLETDIKRDSRKTILSDCDMLKTFNSNKNSVVPLPDNLENKRTRTVKEKKLIKKTLKPNLENSRDPLLANSKSESKSLDNYCDNRDSISHSIPEGESAIPTFDPLSPSNLVPTGSPTPKEAGANTKRHTSDDKDEKQPVGAAALNSVDNLENDVPIENSSVAGPSTSKISKHSLAAQTAKISTTTDATTKHSSCKEQSTVLINRLADVTTKNVDACSTKLESDVPSTPIHTSSTPASAVEKALSSTETPTALESTETNRVACPESSPTAAIQSVTDSACSSTGNSPTKRQRKKNWSLSS